MLLKSVTYLAVLALAIVQVQASDSEPPNWIFKYFDEQRYNSNLLVNEATIDERLYNVIYLVNLVGTSIGQVLDYPDYSTTNPTLYDSSECLAELEGMVAVMDEIKSMVDLRKRDSYGRYESGGLSGRIRYLGSPSQCAESQLVLPQIGTSPRVDMRYCLAKLNASKHLDSTLFHLKRHRYQPSNVILAGICIPKSCHPDGWHLYKLQKLLKKLISSQFKLPQGLYVDDELYVNSIYCGYDDDSSLIQIPWSGKILITFFALWLLIMLLATMFKLDTKKRWLQEVIDAINIKLSLQDLLYSRAQHLKTSRVDLDGLNGIKAAALAFVVLAHAMVLYLVSCANPLKAVNFLENDPGSMLVMNGTIVIDSFFVITGLLLAFVGLRKLKRSKSSDGFAKKSLQFALARYLRLVPLFFLAFWFKKSVLINMGSSVFWDFGYDTKTLGGICRSQSWFSPLTPLGAYESLTQLCLPQSWSILNDLFHCIVLSPVIVLMARRPTLGATIAILIAVLSNYSMFSAFNNMNPNLRASFQQIKVHGLIKFFIEFGHVYTAPHNRIFATAIGIVAGCCLYNYDSGELEWPRWFKGAASRVSMVVIVAQLAVPMLVPMMRQNYLSTDTIFIINPLIMDFAMTIGRFIWCLANAVVFMRMTTDWRTVKDDAAQSGLTGQLWRALSRLNYPMLLIHMDLLLIDAQLQTTIRYYSWYGVWNSFAMAYLTSLVLAIPVHVLIENPLDKLLKLMVQKITSGEVKAGRRQVFARRNVVQPIGGGDKK